MCLITMTALFITSLVTTTVDKVNKIITRSRVIMNVNFQIIKIEHENCVTASPNLLPIGCVQKESIHKRTRKFSNLGCFEFTSNVVFDLIIALETLSYLTK